MDLGEDVGLEREDSRRIEANKRRANYYIATASENAAHCKEFALHFL